MSRLKIICMLLMLLPWAASAQFRSTMLQGDESETVQALRGHVSYWTAAALEGRAAGSEGEKEAAEYLYDILEGYGVEMVCPRQGETFGIARDNGDTLTSRNIIGIVQGYDVKLRDRYIVVGARLDNLAPGVLTVDGEPHVQRYPGANGNASGLAMLAELARMVSINAVLFRRSVIFVGFGASREAFAGSWYFLNRSFSDVPGIDAMINLDMLGAGEEFYAYTASNADLNRLVAAIELPPVKPVLTAGEPYPSDHRSFYSKQIPSVFFTRGIYVQHDSPRDTPDILDYELMERELETVYSLCRDLANLDRAPDFIAESGSESKDDKVYAYDAVDFKPTFLGSAYLGTFLEKWVYPYLKYPPQAVDEKVQGTVHVRFTVDRKGKVGDVKVVRSVHPLLDAEAEKVIAASPKWKPAKLNGKTVPCRITVPVEFKLTKQATFDIKK